MVFHSYHNQNSVTMLRQRKAMGSRSPMNLLLPVQLLLATLSTLTAGAILGTAAHAISVYSKGRAANNPWWLPLWPQHFDTDNTEALIGTAGGVVLLNVVFILLRLLPKLNISSRPLLGAVTTAGISLPAFLLALFSIIFNSVLNKHTMNTDTIQTWTCRFDKSMPIEGITIPESLSNGQFSMICLELKFGEYAMIGVMAFEFVLMISAIPQWFKCNSGSGGRWKDSSSDINMEHISATKT